MLKRLAALTVLAVGSVTAANAATFGGYFSATGTDIFTTNTITFINPAQVAGAIGGDFATYLADGNNINFLNGALPYNQGTNTPPNPPFTQGFVPLFTVAGSSGESFTFDMTQYTATYITPGMNIVGCANGSTCLAVTGTGFFTATGPLAGQSGPATFTFTSQYVAGQPLATITSFSASTGATPAPPIPEPASLALVGTGLVGAFGALRRRFVKA